MEILVALLLSAAQTALGLTNWTEIDEVCGVSNADRIIGGTTAALGQFPWIALVGTVIRGKNETEESSRLRYHCAGSLVHPRYVLTAAHCVSDLHPGERIATVKLGEHNEATEIDCEKDHCADPPQVIYPKRVILPSEYNETMLMHDVALIELQEPANFTRYVSPVCLPSSSMQTNDLKSSTVEVAGWGFYDVDSQAKSHTLQVVRLPAVDISECKKIKQLAQYDFGHSQICAGGVEGKGNGDSGGPLVKAMPLDNYGPRYILFGIVSVGVPSCGKFSLPAVYTNVSQYLPWIYDVIN